MNNKRPRSIHQRHQTKKKKYQSKVNLSKANYKLAKKNFSLSDSDRITRCYQYLDMKNHARKITKVVNVSYEVKINEEWVTIVRFDSDHGYLHRHTRISFKNKGTIVDQDNLIYEGTPNRWFIGEIL